MEIDIVLGWLVPGFHLSSVTSVRNCSCEVEEFTKEFSYCPCCGAEAYSKKEDTKPLKDLETEGFYTRNLDFGCPTSESTYLIGEAVATRVCLPAEIAQGPVKEAQESLSNKKTIVSKYVPLSTLGKPSILLI